MSEPKITLIGAGGLSFGPTMVNDVIHTPALAGSRLMLHDVNAQRLQRAYRFAAKLNAGKGAPVMPRVPAPTPPRRSTGADFCLSSAEFGRFDYWRQDYEIPRRYGATQVNGENGGPGAVFHSLRSIKNTLSICAEHREALPGHVPAEPLEPDEPGDAGDQPGTKVSNVGMCHEMPIGIHRLGRMLRMRPKPTSRPRRRASTTSPSSPNSATPAHRRRSHSPDGELFARKFFDFWPRTQRAGPQSSIAACSARMLGTSSTPRWSPTWSAPTESSPARSTATSASTCPSPIEIGGFHAAHVEQFTSRIDRVIETARDVGRRHEDPGSHCSASVTASKRSCRSSPRCGHDQPAPDHGGQRAEPRLPPQRRGRARSSRSGPRSTANGIHPDTMPPIVEPIAGCIATQIALQDLIVRSALTGDQDLALRAVIEDPRSPRDEAACRKMFDELRSLQAEHLPF